MRGVDTVLFSLCHGNNTKPNCPPFCLSTCIYFVFLFSFLSSACTVRFLGVRLSPSLHHSPTPGTNYIIRPDPFNSYRGKDRKKSRSILYASSITPLLTYSLDPTEEIFIPPSAFLFLSQTLPSPVSHSFHEASPDSVNKGPVVCDTQHTAVWHIIWCSLPLQQDACLGA